MVIAVNNLVKIYGNLMVLDHLNLEVQEGELFGILGPSGSGKTTAVQCMLSLLQYEKGSVRIFDTNMLVSTADIKRNIGVVFQEPAVFNELTVYDNIFYFCSLYEQDKDEVERLVQDAIRDTGLMDYCNFYPGKLGEGLLSRLNVACGIVHKPKLVIFDDPLGNVEVQSRNRIYETIKKLNAEGTTILYTSNCVEEVESLCSRIGLFDKGRMLAVGTKDELKTMISIGEKITVQIDVLEKEIIKKIEEKSNVCMVSYENGVLTVKSKRGKSNLLPLLDFLSKSNIPFGEVASEKPTLKDVFSEITGKELRNVR
ncbi:ABC transporter ATP-binding protein [Anaeromicropila populeti]|uniref:ABC-2 type transport system ATP-binding protein n=1 Tax=Anaeromicropila populeti TaxID=37658 RepID=A0A1I6KR57_9FIRM|nr:ABC transporter ATP-binding protein [Anaeromicropila populeti]SFR93677.1 ABC-2 type transport system ATP-binding protein [Anaeromicropila populeti]